MKTILNPAKSAWKTILERPTKTVDDIEKTVLQIFDDVQKNGDLAVDKYTSLFDGVQIKEKLVTATEIEEAIQAISIELKEAIRVAHRNILLFHKSQKTEKVAVETYRGVFCWQEKRPIQKVGLYIPGGTAPLFSTVLMLAIPAQIVGCKEIVLCSPPNKEGKIHPAILYAANLCGVTKIIKVGGIQAIAGLTFGTKIIPKVYKIFGPGNQYVTKAKELIQREGIAIDMPAGPSEVLVIADESCSPTFVAADLLSQAEHGADSQVILLSNSIEVINQTDVELQKQLNKLPRKKIAGQALENSRAIQLTSIAECIEFSNLYAPEHLIIASEIAESYVDKIINAGSVFLGNYSCESAGDYASGTNHTLPTNGYVRNYSGVSIDSFVRKITFQSLTKEGIAEIGPAIELMADAEELFAHKNAVTLRLKTLQND